MTGPISTPEYVRRFRIHGDNIVECERMLDLIVSAFSSYNAALTGPSGVPTNPTFHMIVEEIGVTFEFVFFPGFGRWDHDVRQVVRDRGGSIRESADAILTDMKAGYEEVALGIEFSAALAAGNQAWQRSGRAYSFGEARIPFLYIAEIGGSELNSQRVERAPRFPNPAVPISYISYSSEINVPVLPVFLESPGITADMREYFAEIIGEDDLYKFIMELLLGNDTSVSSESLENKALTFIKALAARPRARDTLTANEWQEVYQEIKFDNRSPLVSYIQTHSSGDWAKTAYVSSLTDSARSLMNLASELAIAITSRRLPICLIQIHNRRRFASALIKMYPTLTDDFKDWITRDEALVVCWVMGFKPRGDDARPDRGLPPLTRMLVGAETDILTVIYGPAPVAHWTLLMDAPQRLADTNGLWEAIFATTDAILIDSATDAVTRRGFISSHWRKPTSRRLPRHMVVNPIPSRIGEHDVDTIIHTILGRLSGPDVFEGLCNPPGGDWSGISLLTPDRNFELRWLSLPRVSGGDAKRPDHVIQFFGLGINPIVLMIESKATVTSMESAIGPRLKNYMSYLLSHGANSQRSYGDGDSWESTMLTVRESDYELASAAAALINRPRDLDLLEEKTATDLTLGLKFNKDNSSCDILLRSSTDVGRSIATAIGRISLNGLSLRFIAS